MTAPIDDEDELTGKAGGVELSADDESEEQRRKKKKSGDTGEGDSDSFGRGKAGAGAGGGIKLTTQKLKEVMADWRHLDMAAVMEAVTEFFAESPMRASANLVVNWTKNANNSIKSFAIVNWVIKSGSDAVRELARIRARDADAGGMGAGRRSGGGGGQKVQPQKTPQTHKAVKPSMNLGPAGPAGAR